MPDYQNPPTTERQPDGSILIRRGDESPIRVPPPPPRLIEDPKGLRKPPECQP